MNGYSLMANSCRVLAERGILDHETAAKRIRIYDFLASCDADDICTLMDSCAFNDAMRAYVRLAMQDAGFNEESQRNVLLHLKRIMDIHPTKDILAAE